MNGKRRNIWVDPFPFDNLPQSLIKEAVAAQVADGNLLNLVENFLRAGVREAGVFKRMRPKYSRHRQLLHSALVH